MKSLLTLGYCIALASMALAESPDHHKKKHASDEQQSQQQQQVVKPGNAGKHAMHNASHGADASQGANASQLRSQHHLLKTHNANLPASQANAARIKARHFDLKSGPKPEIASVKFTQNRRIEGSERWTGARYTVFRSYRSEWHDQGWWRAHHTRIILIGGGWYFWNAGFWYPAWGYDPAVAYYPYDGPIYAYHNLPPDQVIANVQSALQEQGYYQGEVDGLLGPLTRAALADYQRDYGLYTTAAIDEPTLDALGLT
jgi:Putative peptidoglycan binding domain